MRRVLIAAIIVCILASMLLASAASAQDVGFDAQLFRPSIFGGRFHSIEGAQTHWAMCYGFGMYLNYVSSPMEIRTTVGNKDAEFDKGVLNSVYTANITGAFMPWSWFAIGVDIPVHMYARGYQFEDVETGLQSSDGLASDFNMGDIKAELKFTMVNIDKTRVGLALAPFATFPTGAPDMFLGEGTTNFGGKLLFEVDAVIFNIALNGGYLYRPERDIFNVPLGSAFLYGAGIGRDFSNGLGFSIEGFGSYLDTRNIEVEKGSGAPEELLGNPIEALAFLRYTFPNKIRLIAGGGGGITSGVGAPSYRIVGGIDYHPDCIPPTSGMLIVDVVNEQGVPVGKATLIVTRNKSGTFKTDNNGHFEREAAAGDYSISASAKGYLPNTGAGTIIAGKTTYVKIVLKPVPKPTTLTVSVVHKKSGKPIDGAVIVIKNMTTGKFTGHKAPNGSWSGEYAPGKFRFIGVAKGYERVEIDSDVVIEQNNVVTIRLRKKIIKIGKVQFAFDSDKLLPPAFPVLDDVVNKIKTADFKFKMILIEGHTSSEGSDEYNMNLSTRRATSVMTYLISKGIAKETLEIAPFGESRPIAPNDTELGKEKNRRVEFIFEE